MQKGLKSFEKSMTWKYPRLYWKILYQFIWLDETAAIQLDRTKDDVIVHLTTSTLNTIMKILRLNYNMMDHVHFTKKEKNKNA